MGIWEVETSAKLWDVIESCADVQNVYADMGGNVLVHIAIPALGMVATHWAVISWSKDQVARESFFDAKYVYRCPLLLGLSRVWPPQTPSAGPQPLPSSALPLSCEQASALPRWPFDVHGPVSVLLHTGTGLSSGVPEGLFNGGGKAARSITVPCRLPKEIRLRNLDSKSASNKQAASGVAEYISKLKSAGQKFRDAAHLHRKQRVQFEATGPDHDPQGPAHQKLPSDGTPIGPSVPTAMPSHADLVRAFSLSLHTRQKLLFAALCRSSSYLAWHA